LELTATPEPAWQVKHLMELNNTTTPMTTTTTTTTTTTSTTTATVTFQTKVTTDLVAEDSKV
jgi:hypothetical protein